LIRAVALCVVLAVPACAPVPVTLERADALCREELRGADGVTGNVGVGVGTGGVRAGGSVTVDSRVLNPQTEEEFLADCIARRVNGERPPGRFGITLGGRT